MYSNLKEFISAVLALDNIEDAYYIFEDKSSEDLRALIYSFADPASPEPFRSAMHVMGFTNY